MSIFRDPTTQKKQNRREKSMKQKNKTNKQIKKPEKTRKQKNSSFKGLKKLGKPLTRLTNNNKKYQD